MRKNLRALGILATISCFGLSAAYAANGSWQYGTEARGHPQLVYSENGKTIFMVACGRAFGIHAVYPGAPKKDGEKAAITISNARTKMTFRGEIDSGYKDDPPGATHFVQWDLGFSRQDPATFGPRWKKIEWRLFDLLDAGRPLRISAEGRSYKLPPIHIRGWEQKYKESCG
jgi:hypothetical protein